MWIGIDECFPNFFFFFIYLAFEIALRIWTNIIHLQKIKYAENINVNLNQKTNNQRIRNCNMAICVSLIIAYVKSSTINEFQRQAS